MHLLHPEVVKERDKKEVRAAGTSPAAPAGNQNGNGNGNGPSAPPTLAAVAIRDARNAAAAECGRCDEIGWDDTAGGWCQH